MAQTFIVDKAFISTDQNTKEVQVINTPGGEMHKYMVQVKNQPIQGWFSVLKKPGNEVKPGDELYGEIVENNWGKPQFNREKRPFGNDAPRQSAPTQSTSSQPAGSVEEKLDYLISLVENFLDAHEGRTNSQAGTDTVIEDIDDGPVDLSSLDY